MAFLKFTDVGIKSLAAAVPKNKVINLEYTQYFSAEEVKEVVEKIGVYERRFAPSHICASDLCYAAAEKLLEVNNISRDEIDLLVFVSQTPDYKMPATSVLLQNRLGLSKKTIAFDVNMGCAGFIHGLSIVYSFMATGQMKKALLLDGETRSKVYSPKDRRTAFIFGDGGVAALIESGKEFGESYFSINSDGSKADLIKIKAGGYRYPSSIETLQEKVVDEYGNMRSDEHGFMDGGEVFNFLIKEIPPDIKRIFEFSGISRESIDYIVFHQANKFMNDYLVKKLKIEEAKAPFSIHKYGNTSSVSIPLTIADSLAGKLKGKKVLLSGFGVGMTWASAILNFDDCVIPEIVELE